MQARSSAREVSRVEIRPLLPGDDRLALSGVYEASWRRAYRGIVPQDCLDALPAGRWSGFFDTPGVCTLVAVDGDVYAGTASFGASRFPEYGGEGELISLYLRPEYVGRGLGRALLSAALNALADMGFDAVFLWVLEENAAARAFYERMGFVRGGETLCEEIGGKTLRELRYVRSGKGGV